MSQRRPVFFVEPLAQARWSALISLLPQNAIESLESALLQSAIPCGGRAYLSRALDFSVAAFSAVLLAGLVLFPGRALVAGIACLFLVPLLCVAYPFALRARVASQVESELGVTLQSISLLLHFGQGFDEAVSRAPKGAAVSRLFRSYIRRVESGSCADAALAAVSLEADSAAWRRACGQLGFAYRNGTVNDYLDAAAEELYSLQRQNYKKFGQRLSFFGLLFCAAGCLAPALYGAYALMSPVISPGAAASSAERCVEAYAAYLAVFPAALLCIAFAAAYASPLPPDFFENGKNGR